jgi:hypothetical protein
VFFRPCIKPAITPLQTSDNIQHPTTLPRDSSTRHLISKTLPPPPTSLHRAATSLNMDVCVCGEAAVGSGRDATPRCTSEFAGDKRGSPRFDLLKREGGLSYMVSRGSFSSLGTCQTTSLSEAAIAEAVNAQGCVRSIFRRGTMLRPSHRLSNAVSRRNPRVLLLALLQRKRNDHSGSLRSARRTRQVQVNSSCIQYFSRRRNATFSHSLLFQTRSF